MKCYYEVLEVARDASDSDIKTAYRKLALKWHPDKNLDDVENAKEQFQVVQQAYEVLSDRQERAWYDNHREQILRGSNSEFEDNCLDVFPYFTTSCFKGYDDSDKGFYTVYRTVFEKIAKEDMEFMDNKEEFCEIPQFGHSSSDYETTVGPFYAYWMSYSTKKSYVWLDPYNINETRERRVIKLIEKENKKVRQKAKKERNDEIRNLVAFVRKRDKRVIAYNKQMEEKNLENRKKHELISKQKRLERLREHENVEQAEWSKFDNVKTELEQIEKNLAQEFGEDLTNSEDEAEEDYSDLYCAACNKVFKTPKAFENHESSKKHRENVERLKQEMLDEEDVLDEEDFLNVGDVVDEEDLLAVEDEECLSDAKEEDCDIDEPIPDPQHTKTKKKNKKSKVVLNGHHDEEEHDFPLHQQSDSEEFDFQATKKQQKKKNKKKANEKPKEEPEKVTATEENTQEIEEAKDNKKRKKEKKGKKDVDEKEADLDVNHCCVTCKSDFPSKNKLFDHLKKTGHGVYIPNKTSGKSNKRNCDK